MVIAYHLVFGCYGFWLPNDPRGSCSRYVGSRELLYFGAATKVNTRRSLAHREHNNDNRLAAKERLKYPPVKLTGHQALAVANGIDTARSQSGYRLFALCVMPDHVHTVIATHTTKPKQIIGHLKGSATMKLAEEGRHPMVKYPGKPTPWSRGGWCVFLNTDDEARRAIQYVNENPIKEGLRQQTWSFVESF